MNVLIIPSWYPSEDEPTTGIFFLEQAKLLSSMHKEHNFAISTWGSHEHKLWIDQQSGIKNIKKLLALLPDRTFRKISPNLIEYFSPSYTWSTRILSGNIKSIVDANLINLRSFEQDIGPISIIHAHVAYPAGFIAMRLSELLKIPYIITEHMSPFPFQSFVDAKSRISRRVLKSLANAGKIISVSSNLQQQILEKTGLNSSVIHNTIDEQRFQVGKYPSSKRMLFVGRLEKQKAVSDLLEAWLQISKRRREWNLTIIGEGSEKPSLLNQAAELGLDRITWKTWLSQDKLAQAYQEHDFLVLPSLHENNPLVLLEALTCGLPVISTKWDGAEEIINEKNGLLCKPADPEGLMQTIEKMISKFDQFDPEKIRTDCLNRFSSSVIGRQIFKVYEEVIREQEARK